MSSSRYWELWDVVDIKRAYSILVHWISSHHILLAYSGILLLAGAAWYSNRRKWKKELLKVKKDAASYHRELLGSKLNQDLLTEWLNILVHSTWNQFLEREVSLRLAKQLRESVRKTMKGSENKKKGFSRFVQSFDVEEFCLGCVPPTIGPAIVERDMQNNQLNFDFDLSFLSVGMKAVVNVEFRPHSMLKKMQGLMEITSIVLDGRVQLSLQLCDEFPGISSYSFCFVKNPNLTIKSSPSGSKLLEFPGVGNIISDFIKNFVNSKFVHPKRTTVNLKRRIEARSSNVANGAGGVLKVLLQGISNLPSSGISRLIVCRASFGKELRYSRMIRRSKSPVWKDAFFFPLPAETELTDARLDDLWISCFNVAKVDIQRFGQGKISVRELIETGKLQRNVQPFAFPLEINEEGAIIQLSLQWLPHQRDHSFKRGSDHLAFMTCMGQVVSRYPAMTRQTMAGEGTSNAETSVGNVKVKDALGFMFRILKLRDVIQEERSARTKLERQLASLTNFFRETVEEELEDLLRSLLEGAKFLIASSQTRAIEQHIWLDHEGWNVCWDKEKVSNASGSVHYKKITSVLDGTDSFGDRLLRPYHGEGRPHSFGHYHHGFPNKKLGFSILFEDNRALHLHLPRAGNGRSQREWFKAFSRLQDGSFNLEK